MVRIDVLSKPLTQVRGEKNVVVEKLNRKKQKLATAHRSLELKRVIIYSMTEKVMKYLKELKRLRLETNNLHQFHGLDGVHGVVARLCKFPQAHHYCYR